MSKAESEPMSETAIDQMLDDARFVDEWCKSHPLDPLTQRIEGEAKLFGDKATVGQGRPFARFLAQARADVTLRPLPVATPEEIQSKTAALAAAEKLSQRATELLNLIQQLCALGPISNDGTDPVAEASSQEKCELAIELSSQILTILEGFALQYTDQTIERALAYFRAYQNLVNALLAPENKENQVAAEKAAAEFAELGALDCESLSNRLIRSRRALCAQGSSDRSG
jgi:hypothetical protein